jgi:6,7-dimethyl-8-ribityllumazine synthase
MASTERAVHDRGDRGAVAAGSADATVFVGDPGGISARLGVVCSRFNAKVTARLLAGARRAWRDAGLEDASVVVVEVPGAFELPLAARSLAGSGHVDAIACLGAVIRGETSHYELVAGQCAAGCQRVQLDTGVPVAFGVLTTDDLAQALARSGGAKGDKGYEAVETALEMLALIRVLGSVAG